MKAKILLIGGNFAAAVAITSAAIGAGQIHTTPGNEIVNTIPFTKTKPVAQIPRLPSRSILGSGLTPKEYGEMLQSTRRQKWVK